MKKADRKIVHDKYGGRCAYCGCKLEKGWHVDHIEPVRRAYDWDYDKGVDKFVGYMHPARDTIENMMPSCPSCNINKHGDTIEQFRANILGYLNSLNLRMVQYKIVKRYGLVVETKEPVIFYFEIFNDANAEHSNNNHTQG